MTKELVLVDFGTLFGTSWFSVTASDGQTEEVVHQGVLDKLDFWLTDLAREGDIIVCFDSPPYARKAMYDGYKASRAKRPAGFGITRDAACAAARAKFKTAEHPGAEADDVIATLCAAHETALPGGARTHSAIRIVSRDKDLLCLVDEKSGIYVHDPGAKDESLRFLRTASDVEFRMGVPPWQVPALLALAGDAADDIPGARGLGPKGAIKLITEFGSVADILKAADSASSTMDPKGRKLVTQSRQNIVLSAALVELTVCRGLTVAEPGSPAPEPTEQDVEEWNDVAEQIHERSQQYKFQRDKSLNIYQRMNLVMEEVSHVKKGQRNKAQGYNYAGHDSLTELLHGPYTRFGIVRTCSMVKYHVTEDKDLHAIVKVRWTNIDNPFDYHEVKSVGVAPCTSGKDGPRKLAATQSGVALSYAQKNAEFKAFAIAGDDTPDAEQG